MQSDWNEEILYDDDTQNPAADYETIFFSGGRIGFQIELAFSDLQKAIKIQTADIISSDILPE